MRALTNEPVMDVARVLQVIETTITRRGDGVDDPLRIIRQYWDFDGNLLAEVDPCDSLPNGGLRAIPRAS